MINNPSIYLIINTINQNIYIGSSINFNQRRNKHLNDLRNNKHHSSYLQRSFDKHGENTFRFYIVENCKETELIEREQFWMNKLKPEYNISKIAGKNTGYKHSTETKKLLSYLSKGRKLSKEHKEKISRKLKGIKYPQYNKKIKSIDLITKEELKFKSVTDCSKYFNTTITTISRVLRGSRKSFARKYKIIYDI